MRLLSVFSPEKLFLYNIFSPINLAFLLLLCYTSAGKGCEDGWNEH